MNVINKSSNLYQFLSPLLSFIPPPGIELGLNAYMNDPALCQPTKKALSGDQMSLVTAARMTSTSASPAQMSLYTNKRNAISSPTKGAIEF